MSSYDFVNILEFLFRIKEIVKCFKEVCIRILNWFILKFLWVGRNNGRVD